MFGKRSQPSPSFITVAAVSAAFGLFAGIVGTLVGFANFDPYANLLSLPAAPRRAVPGTLEVAGSPVEAASRSVAVLYPARPAGRLQPFVPTEAAGAAVVLTSDGWLMTTAAGSKLAGLVAVVGGKSYAVTATVEDPYSGVTFVKVEAVNLPVASFVKEVGIAAGDSVFAFDVLAGARRADFIGLGNAPTADPKAPVRSSERLQKILRLSLPADALVGSALVDRRGDVLGIYAGTADGAAYAVPVTAFAGRIGEVLRERRISRPYLGVHYLDLSEAIDAPAGNRGVLLAEGEGGKLPAVERSSPAAAAGLRRGDVILAVAGEDLTARTALADLVAEYAPASAVAVTVRRGSETFKVDVTFTAGPARAAAPR